MYKPCVLSAALSNSLTLDPLSMILEAIQLRIKKQCWAYQTYVNVCRVRSLKIIIPNGLST